MVKMKSRLVLMESSYRGWILEGIVRESSAAVGIRPRIVWIPSKKRDMLNVKNLFSLLRFLSLSKSILIVNQKLYLRLRKIPGIWYLAKLGKCVDIYFTHETDISELAIYCNADEQLRSVITFNFEDSTKLKKCLSPRIQIKVSYGAVDRFTYKPILYQEAGKKKFVLIAGIMNQRKNPDKIKRIIESNPDIEFVIHGDNWDRLWADEGKSLSNLQILEFELSRHPNLIREASCLLSISNLEGGPYPTLESLASGTPVVASRTGWNPELVNSKNGVLLQAEFSESDVRLAILTAFEIKSRSGETDLLPKEYNWERVGRSLF
jgi:glycosyltransferase involved in cell wall biosynthesis